MHNLCPVFHLCASFPKGLFLVIPHNVQVEDRVFSCTWNLRGSVWEMEVDTALPNQYSITVPSTFVSLPSSSPHSSQQQQQQQRVPFKLYVSSPRMFRLLGWQVCGSVQTLSEGQPEMGDTLQLLAHTQGRFLPVDIVHVDSRDDHGGQSVEVGNVTRPDWELLGTALNASACPVLVVSSTAVLYGVLARVPDK